MFCVLLLLITYHFVDSKTANNFSEIRLSSKYENPNFIRDRDHYEIIKPMLPEGVKNRYRKPYSPAWMDYCDPYHCNDYHSLACGVNRHKMKFKWFQSKCHIILHNICAQYRGALLYDVIDNKYCSSHVLFTRSGCPSVCPDTIRPTCAISLRDNHLAIFKNHCHLDRTNCNGFLEEYEPVDKEICALI